MSSTNQVKHPATLWIFLAVIGVALGGAIYMMRRADARIQTVDGRSEDKAIPVEAFVVRPRTVPQIIEARGFLSGIDELSITSEVDGRVVTRALEDGASVEAGDILIEIDDTFYALAAAQAKAELARSVAMRDEAKAATEQACAQLEAATARRSNAADEFERIERIRETGASPPVEYNRISTALETAEANLRAAQASKVRFTNQLTVADAAIAIAQASFDNAQARLERCVIRSPISGRVNRFYIEPGELAGAGTPLVELVRLDQMKILVEFSGPDIGLIELLTRAEVSIDSAPHRKYSGRLHHVAPKMDPVSRKFQVELLVDNPDESLLSGMFGHARLHCGELTEAMTIPREAIFKHYGVDHCHVVSQEDGQLVSRVQKVEIEAVRAHLDQVRVISGLEDGDLVVLTRRREVRDGTPIVVGRRIDPDLFAQRQP